MTKRVAVKLIADGSEFAKESSDQILSLRQRMRAAGQEIAKDFGGSFKKGAVEAEQAVRAATGSIESLVKSASLTNGMLRFDRGALNADLGEARQYLAVQQQLATALDRVAAEEGQTGAAARARQAAQQALIATAQQNIRGIEQEIALLDRLEGELGGAAVAQARLGQASGQLNQSTGALRAGMSNLNFQIQDIFQGIAAGVSPFTILAQQGSQLASSLVDIFQASQPVAGAVGGAATSITGLNSATSAAKSSTLQLAAADVAAVGPTNALSAAARVEAGAIAGVATSAGAAAVATTQMTTATRIATFAAGPMGAALIALVSVGGAFAWSMRGGAEAAKELTTASDNLGQAQSLLGQMFDLSTGKIANNTQALRDNIYMNMIAMQQKAIIARQEGEKLLADSGAGRTSLFDRAWTRVRGFALRGQGGMEIAEQALAMQEARGRQWEDLGRGVAQGGMSREAAGRILEGRRGQMDDEQYFALQNFLNRSAEERSATQAYRDMETALGGRLPGGYLKPDEKKGGGKKSGRGDAEREAKAAEVLSNKLGEAFEKAVALRGQFDRMPGDIDRANNALIDADQIIADMDKKLKDGKLTDVQRKAAEQTRTIAQEAKALAEAAPNRPMADMLRDMEQAVTQQRLLIDGRKAEYHTLEDNVELARQLGAEDLSQLPVLIQKRKISSDQLKNYYLQRQELRLQTIELERQQREQDKLLQVVENVEAVTKQAIYDFYDGKGLGAAKNYIKGLFEIQKQAMTEETYKLIFGDTLEKQKLKILGLDKVDESGRAMSKAIDKTIDPILALGEAAAIAAGKLGVANDNMPWGEDAKWLPGDARDDSINVYGSLSPQMALRDALKGLGNEIFGPRLSAQLGQAFQGALQGAAYGQAASGVLRSLGAKQSGTGAAIGGAIGNLVLPGIGGFIGGALGGTIGGLFKKTPKGSSTITSAEEAGVYTGSSKLREAVSGLASGVQGQLASIADALDAEIGAFRVSIGKKKDSFYVDPSGQGRLKGAGVLKFASEEEAVAAALRDALADGAIKGISAAAQRILQQGKDVQKALEKAAMIEAIPKLLQARVNPLAHALDELNDKWDKTVAALREGGASAEQFAEAEKLYQLERADALKAANDNLREFIDSLTIGPNSGLSVRDQAAAAQAQLQPYLDAIASGNIAGIDRDKYLSLADQALQLSRSLNGSGAAYFATVEQLRQATQSLLAQSESGSAAAQARDPFGAATATATQAAANILGDHTGLLEGILSTQQQLLAAIGSHQYFVGANRFFTASGAR